ncbi:MAG: helix-turn-helix domain-containing protein [Cytophagaceae bacterium]|jgi:transposase-like protein|nr:helix-turn-helix domain-containing protein [Cytophagaceae bacterium]
MNCPKCQSAEFIKNGIVKNRQRFRCKNCGNNYTVNKRANTVDSHLKRNALLLYLSGYNTLQIASVLGVSHVSIYNWVLRYCSQHIQEIRSSNYESSILSRIEDIEKFPEEDRYAYILTPIGSEDEAPCIISKKHPSAGSSPDHLDSSSSLEEVFNSIHA